jgi:hypothetical protein
MPPMHKMLRLHRWTSQQTLFDSSQSEPLCLGLPYRSGMNKAAIPVPVPAPVLHQSSPADEPAELSIRCKGAQTGRSV